MTTLAHRNRRVGSIMILLVIGMTALGFASAPLYRIFCQVTGFGGTPVRAETVNFQPPVVGKLIDVRFDANISPALGWRFKPEKEVQRSAIGARQMAFFTATNLTDKPISGTATFNVTPLQSGQYFTKIQCFCFEQQTLQPGETVRMPVIYTVDPKILENPDTKNIQEITLSYTFFPMDSPGTKG